LKTLAVIGGTGLLGSTLVSYFEGKYTVIFINRENYAEHVGTNFDIIINANGNSRRFWANQNPLDDFLASTASVHESVLDFSCDLYIYISSTDVYENHVEQKSTEESVNISPMGLSSYGFNKYLGELIVKKYSQKYLILRSSMMLGSKLKKGPFYDIINNNPIYVTLQTKLQLITTNAIAEIIEVLLENTIRNEIINVGGTGVFNFMDIQKYFDYKVKVSSEAETQLYNMNVRKLKSIYPGLKKSEEYLQDYLKFNYYG